MAQNSERKTPRSIVGRASLAEDAHWVAIVAAGVVKRGLANDERKKLAGGDKISVLPAYSGGNPDQ